MTWADAWNVAFAIVRRSLELAIACVAKRSSGIRGACDRLVAFAIVPGASELVIAFRGKHSREPGRAGDSYWAGAQARNYLARPRSGRLLFGEALARGG